MLVLKRSLARWRLWPRAWCLGAVLLLLLTVVLGASFAQSTFPADASAQGISPLDCSGNTIYQLQRLQTGSTEAKLNTVAVAPMTANFTGPVAATQVGPSLLAGVGNALGITDSGRSAWALAPQQPGGTGNNLTFTLHEFDTATGAWTSRTATINAPDSSLPSGVTRENIRSGGIVAGAVDPLSGNFYWAYLSSGNVDRMTIFGWDTTANRSLGIVANATLPQQTTSTSGSNGDIAFDGGGNLYVVSNTGTSAAVGVIAHLPTSEQTPPPFLETRQLTTFANPDSHSYNGIAFNGAGELFIQWVSGSGATESTMIRKISPGDGASIAGPSTVNYTPAGGGRGVDLGGCATPPSLELRKDVVARRADTDQWHLEITGDGLTEGNTGTTRGTAPGVQDQPGEIAGPVVARANTEYTFTETAHGTTNLDHYGTTFSCVDQAGRDVPTNPPGPTGRQFTLTPAAGQAIVCTFTNDYPAKPNIRVVKRGVLDVGPDTLPSVGDTIHYTIRVRNTGNTTLHNVTVTEERLAGMSAIVCPPNGDNVIPVLGVRRSVTCTATYQLTQADINNQSVTNFVTGTGRDPNNREVEDGDDANVPVAAVPRLNVKKTAKLNKGANGVAGVGDLIRYRIRVRNTGNVPLTDVTVTDTLLRTIVCPPNGNHIIPTLAVGESVTCRATHRLTQHDVDAGYVPNFATATGTPPRGPDVRDGDDAEVPITRRPGIEVVKTGKLNTGGDGVAGVGDLIHYTITVRNTGNVTLRNVRVVEQTLAGLSAIVCPPNGNHIIPSLAAGHEAKCHATYKVTSADAEVGYVPNFATATGRPPHGPDIRDGDDEEVPVKAVPGLDVVKTGRLSTGADGVAGVGDIIHYTITVRNTGNVVLRNVRVVEQSLAGLSAIRCGGGGNVIATLRVGQSVTCTATYRVTQDDVRVGYVPNFATATGTPPRGPDVTDGDNHVEQIGGLALHKTARPAVVARGSTVRFTLRVTNTSGIAVHGVRVCDHQPRGFHVVRAPGFRVRGRTVCKFIGTLKPGHSRTVVFTARAGSRAASRVTNTATATSRNARAVRARARVSIRARRRTRPVVTG